MQSFSYNKDGMRKRPRSKMKINPYSNSYTSSSRRASDSSEPARGADRYADSLRNRDSQSNAENRHRVQRHSFDKQADAQNAAAAKAAKRRIPALEDGSQNAPRHPVDYYAGVSHSKQTSDHQGFFVSPSDPVAGREGDYADIKRVNNHVMSHAVASYREHQAMNEEEAQRQEHQWILGVDTYA